MIEEFRKKRDERKVLDGAGSRGGVLHFPALSLEDSPGELQMILCDSCKEPMDSEAFVRFLKTCPFCNYHHRLNARERISLLTDSGSFQEMDRELTTRDILSFPEYGQKVESTRDKTGEREGLVSGVASFAGHRAVVCAMNPDFFMGSMGAVVGEKITRAVEYAIQEDLPVVIFSASGGARMQEGIVSLMQMAKTSAALGRLDEMGLLYISVLTDPTTGGVTASFSMLGDIILAEPGALIGFAGPRVIEQTIRQKLPQGFQRAEFLLEKGFVDAVVTRGEMRGYLGQLIGLHKREAK